MSPHLEGAARTIWSRLLQGGSLPCIPPNSTLASHIALQVTALVADVASLTLVVAAAEGLYSGGVW